MLVYLYAYKDKGFELVVMPKYNYLLYILFYGID